jgi:adenylate cyclase
MKNLLKSQINSSLRAEWPNSLLLLVLVFVFSSTTLGFLEFNGDVVAGIKVRGEIFLGRDNSFSLPEIATSWEFLMLVLSGLTLSLLLPLLSPIGASFLVLVLAIPPFWLELYYPYHDNVVPMQFSLLVLLVLFGINVLLKYFAETQQKQKLLDAFSQYVPPQIVGELGSKTRQLMLEGESRFLTVFFCDLRNFTGMSEKLDPKDVVKLLNEYFTIMTSVLYRYGATIDKYVGDSIMAFWGAPLPQEDHAQRAVLAAFEMHSEMHKLSGIFHARGLPTPTIGIGINSGVMNVGNMGSRYRLAYTVIGDPVNLAFRLQGTTREYGVSTIVGENTAKAYTDMIFRELDTVTVRGKTKGSHIFEPVCLKAQLSPELTEKLSRHQDALTAYHGSDRVHAEQLFKAMFRDYPDDPYYPAMLAKLMTQVYPRTPTA